MHFQRKVCLENEGQRATKKMFDVLMSIIKRLL